jgi:RHH-type proline utilization regulon transcriptional repressor/proline dehydrogenase/delta 1-pyrroline-5-carboxylate dehydrogenase
MALFSKKTKPVQVDAQADARTGDRIRAIGEDMLARAKSHKAGILSSRFYSDKLMNWSMRDHDFKVQLFRFVDTFPMLKTPDAVHDHLVDYMSQPGVNPPPGLDLGLKASGIAKGLAARTISGQITSMASKFIAGVDAAGALPGLKKLWDDKIAFSVDLLGEACVSDREADAYRDKYLDLVNNLPEEVSSWKRHEHLESDHLGPIPRTNVSIKISSLSARCDPIDTEGAIADLMTRIIPILEAARDRAVFINFDMEQFALKDLTLELFMRCCEKVAFHAGLAVQAYLKSGVDDAKRIADWARSAGRTVSVRLVKGAYWDYETIHAEEMGWPCPVWNEKWQTDKCFEDMADVFLDATPGGAGILPASAERKLRAPASASQGGIKLAIGSHNVRSIAHALAGLELRSLPSNAIELQMLHGMADQLKHAATDMGLRVREYVPVGEMIPGMAYLVRRLLENTSNESWLKAGFLEGADPATLLADPSGTALRAVGGTALRAVSNGQPTNTEPRISTKRDLYELAPERHQLSRAPHGVANDKPFINEPFRDFSRKPVREAFAAAIANAQVPHVANDKTPEDALKMVARAEQLFDTYRDSDPRARANALIHAASLMRDRRDELAGVMIKEAGKTWREADADVCEAIDFCEYYAREAVQLFDRRRLGRFIGELDEVWHQPRGVAVVIAPWNFPSAIATGMTTAALVCANTTILKPAEQTPGIAKIICDILWQSLDKHALPRDALQFCPAPGETTGATLVRDPRIAIIAFTGSKSVGLDIIQAAGHTPQSAPHGGAGILPANGGAGDGGVGNGGVGVSPAQSGAAAPPSSPLPTGEVSVESSTLTEGVRDRTGAAQTSAPPRPHVSASDLQASKPQAFKPPYPPSAYPQPHVKKVICEMGGKNAIIVDTSADLDEAVLGIRLSAFGFQGQKCSACSRIIVVDPAGPQGPAINLFTERFVESTRSYIVKNPLHPGADMGPVIDEEAAAKIRHYIKIAQDEGATMLLGDGGAGILPASTSPERKLGVPSSPALAGEVSVKSATLTEGARSPSDQPGTAGAGDPPSDPSVASSLRRFRAPPRKSSAPSSPSCTPRPSTTPSPSPTPSHTSSPAPSSPESPPTSTAPNPASASATSTSTAPAPAPSSPANPSAASP